MGFVNMNHVLVTQSSTAPLQHPLIPALPTLVLTPKSQFVFTNTFNVDTLSIAILLLTQWRLIQFTSFLGRIPKPQQAHLPTTEKAA